MEDDDPIIELIYNEVNAQRVMNKLKLGGKANGELSQYEQAKNNQRQVFYDAYEIAYADLSLVIDTFEGKTRRKEIRNLAVKLNDDGKRGLWMRLSFTNTQRPQAFISFSKSIIDAFKKLPRG